MQNRKITGVMACDPQGVMSFKHHLPWDCPEDVAFYLTTTEQQIIIVGHTTFLELPTSFIEQRYCVVFSICPPASSERDNVVFVSSLEAFDRLDCLPLDKTCYLIGGSQMAKFFLENNRLDDLLLTEIVASYPGDTFFPLALIAKWPKTCIKKTKDFSINHYVNPYKS